MIQCEQKMIDQNLKEYIEEFEGELYDGRSYKYILSKYFVKFTKSMKIMYISSDGAILRTDKIREHEKQSEFLNNLEQIYHLQWVGDYGKDNNKLGKWCAIWNGEILLDTGGYYKDGKKQGLWKELSKNYWSGFSAYEIGEYINDKRRGRWKYQFYNLEIQGGEYNEQGQKKGKWIELWNSTSSATYEGQYENGKKLGYWVITYGARQIGNGLYNYDGQENKGQLDTKNGFWTELSDRFSVDNQVVYYGKYKVGKKIGRWDIFITHYNKKEMIGGGSYNYEGEKDGQENIKNGKWVELSDGFNWNSQVIYEGEYKNGKKSGNWSTLYCHRRDKEFTLIGGGVYDEEEVQGNQKKGLWIDLIDGYFSDDGQAFYKGEYKNGKKVGRWDIYKRFIYPQWKICDKFGNNNSVANFYLIGGGNYDEGDSQNELENYKNGFWVDFCNLSPFGSYITYCGEYKNGKKLGSWDIILTDQWYFKKVKIGGGSYINQEGKFKWRNLKNGKWIELDDRCIWSEYMYRGQYKNGKKIGNWEILYVHSCGEKKIGGGSYVNKGQNDGQRNQKHGKWIEVIEWSNYNQQTYLGEYINGKKVGIWQLCNEKEKIGGGLYNIQKGYQGQKIGLWIEASREFCYKGEYENGKKVDKWDTLLNGKITNMNIYKDNQLLNVYLFDIQNRKIGKWIEYEGHIYYYGSYKKGKRVGQWEIYFKCLENFEKIGGGFYDEQEGEENCKNGKWIELINGYSDSNQITYSGEYMNGKKVGRWDIFRKFEQIGSLNENNQKVGQWIEKIQKPIPQNSQITTLIYKGQYKNDQKVGRWDICWKYDGNIEKIGGGQYGLSLENGEEKIGKWIEPSDLFHKNDQTIYVGEYKNGKKIGIWDEMKRVSRWQQFIKMGYQKYREQLTKIKKK